MSDEIEICKSHCNKCGHKTDHTVVFTKRDEDSHWLENYGEIYWIKTTKLLDCCGCHELSLLKTSWFSEDEELVEEYFPPRVSRPKPKWIRRLPSEYRALLDEIYIALHSDSRCLAMMGARAVIDLFIQRKVDDQGTFDKGMAALEKQGFISAKDRLVIDAAVDAGSAASHRAYFPSAHEASLVMDIVENLIQHDVLHDAAQSLRDSTPPRVPKNKKDKDE